MKKVKLTLYVNDSVPGSRRAIDALRELTQGTAECEITIVDVLEEPGQAESARIVATPTLVREDSEGPALRVIGDLTQVQDLGIALRLELRTTVGDTSREDA